MNMAQMPRSNIHLEMKFIVEQSNPEVSSMIVALDELKDEEFRHEILQSSLNE